MSTLANGRPPNIEAVIHSIAARQYALVTRRQLLDAGIACHVIDRRITSGRLRPVHRGVYQVGPVRPEGAREMSACLACGLTAAVSHRSAAGLWRMLPREPGDAPVEVSVVRGHPRRPGIRVHRTESLEKGEVTRVRWIPVTSPGRTLLDLAVTAAPRSIERALTEALSLKLVTTTKVRATLDRHSGRPGSRRLRAVLDPDHPNLTRSEAEERFLDIVRGAGLAAPRSNVQLGRYEVDFLWRANRLVVEVDGYAFHSSTRAFERDRRRDGELAGLGFRVMRVTWRMLVNEPMRVVVLLARALDAGR